VQENDEPAIVGEWCMNHEGMPSLIDRSGERKCSIRAFQAARNPILYENSFHLIERILIVSPVLEADCRVDSQPVICGGISRRRGYLVTGDNHLQKLKQYGGTKIVNAKDFLEIQAQQRKGR
jgi:hypothetical protein